MKGKVKKIKLDYGFIEGKDGIDYFFHKNDLDKDNTVWPIGKGSEVEFILKKSRKGPAAERITVIKKTASYQAETKYSDGRLIRGLKRNLNIKGNPEEILITEKFSNYFGITFSREERFKDKLYKFNFLQPSETYQKSFNMFNEVLMLFSPFETYDRRAMDFVDKSFTEYNNRIDKIIVILVSRDSDIKNKIPKDSESRIVVPFTYDEILKTDFHESIIKSRLRDYFYKRDLFAMESALKSDSYFYGRKDIVHNLYAKYALGENSGLFGLRKTGKTSVLYAIERTIKTEDGLSIYIDCQDPSIYKLRWFQVFEEIVRLIDEKYNLNILSRKDLSFNEASASRDFASYLREIYNIRKKRILLIFDEIEHISFDLSDEKHWKNGSDYLSFWRSIRAKSQSDPELFSFIVAGVNPKIIEEASVNDNDNPIFNFTSIRYLDLFKLKDVENMVREIGGYMGLDFEDSVLAKLHENYGGHPFLIRNVCSMLSKKFSARPYMINKRDYNDNKEDIDVNLSTYIQSIVFVLKKWYLQEFNILKDISLGNKMKYISELNNNKNSINHLLNYGIVVKSLKSNYYIEIDAIRTYMKSEFKTDYIPSKEVEIRQLISLRRNQIEIELRKKVEIGLQIKYTSSGLTKVLQKYVNVEETKSRNPSGKVWEGLYFNDLKKIVNGEFKHLKNLLDIEQTAFNETMSKVNEYRRVDAHASSISPKEYEELHIYFNVLENALGIEN